MQPAKIFDPRKIDSRNGPLPDLQRFKESDMGFFKKSEQDLRDSSKNRVQKYLDKAGLSRAYIDSVWAMCYKGDHDAAHRQALGKIHPREKHGFLLWDREVFPEDYVLNAHYLN
jgi:hypothetical protein